MADADGSMAEDQGVLLQEILSRLSVIDEKLDAMALWFEAESPGELAHRVASVEDQMRKYYYEILRMVRVSREQLPSEVVEYGVVRSVFSSSWNEMPQLGGWRLNPTTMVSLVRYLGSQNEIRNGVIVDLGSGASTIWFATAIRQASIDARVYTVDHDPEYLAETMSALKAAGLDDYVIPILAPLVPYPSDGGRRENWYDTSRLQHLDGIDLLLVDGPPGGVVETARWPAVPFFSSRMKDNSLVCLDDTFRRGESKIAGAWLADYSELKMVKNDGAATLFKWK